MFIIFCSYGLGMYYGASEVARDLRNGCTGEHCKTGGDVLTVFWAILNGAMVSDPEAWFERLTAPLPFVSLLVEAA